MQVAHKGERVNRPKEDIRNPELMGHIKCERHGCIRNNASNRRHIRRIVEPSHKIPERRQRMNGGRNTQLNDVGEIIRALRRRKAIGDGLETKGGRVSDRGKRSERTPVAKISVDKGDVKASVVKKLG